jgi:Sensors of blue-light using FAD
MTLLLTAIDGSGEVREFSCQLPQLESGFDLLTYMDDKGHTLVKARILDEGGSTRLPLKTDAVHPAFPIVQELAPDWRQVLEKSAGAVTGQPDNDNISRPAIPDQCLVYFSTSVGLFQEEDIASILQQSRRNNAKAHITGLLLYMNGSIIQVLEGEKEVIEALYARIAQDQRHTHVICVLNRPISQRLFARWSMAYETLTMSQLDEIESVVSLNKWKEAATQTDDSIILKTLKAFYETNRQ